MRFNVTHNVTQIARKHLFWQGKPPVSENHHKTKTTDNHLIISRLSVLPLGLEPRTPTLRVSCSTN